MARRSVVELVLQAKDQASPTIQNVTRSTGALGKAAGVAAVGLGALGAAFAAVKAAGVVVDLARSAEAAGRLEESFRSLADSTEDSADDILDALKSISEGTISESDLILGANRAIMLGVADNADDLAALLEVAIERGQALGVGASQAFNDIVTGIGRVSPLILDNLGIVTGGEATYEAFAQSIGKTADELTEAEKKQALVNKVIADADGAIDGTIDAFSQLESAVADAKDELGEVFAPAVIAGAQGLTTVIRGLQEDVDDLNQASADRSLEVLARSINQVKDEISALQSDMSGMHETSNAYANASTDLAAKQNELAVLTERYQSALIAAYPAQQQSNNELNRTSIEAQTAAQAIATVTGEIERLAYGSNALDFTMGEIFDPFIDRAEQTIRSLGSGLFGQGILGAGGTADFIEQSNQKIREQITLWQNAGYEQNYINEVLLPGYTSSLDDGIRKTHQLSRATSKVSDEYRDLESTVSGILSGAVGPVSGVDAADFLPYEDDIAENAKRLADIMVNGFKGQEWLDEFRNEVPDVYQALVESGDPKLAAAQILKDFQDGLRPDLLDKERAKELVKRAITGEENLQALVKEISGELASELGISLQEAQTKAAQVLTGGGGATGGKAGTGSALTDGMIDSVDGGAVVDTVVTQIAAKFDSIVQSGNAAGKQWGDGFLAAVGESVPQPLVDILVNLVTPGVMAAFNRNDGMTGATS